MKVTDPDVRPLTKRKGDKTLYFRSQAVETQIGEVLSLPNERIGEDCSIVDPEHRNYIASEVIVHLLRSNRISYDHRCNEILWRTLVGRVLKQIGCKSHPESPLSAREDTVRSYVVDALVDLFLKDKEKTCSRLDFYEVRFGRAVKTLEVGGERKYHREKKTRAPLEIDPEFGEISVDAERSAASFGPIEPNKLDDPNYRRRLEEAIDGLEPMQQKIIHLLRLGYPIESSDVEKTSVSGILGKAEKTIRNQRDKAFRLLRELLREE